MKRYLLLLFALCFTINSTFSQELFPNTEPASTIPKGVIGVRQMNEFFNELTAFRKWDCLQFMYGVSSKLSVYATFSASNHHGSDIPDTYVIHNSDGTFDTHGIKYGQYYPYKFDGVDFYAKYKFLSTDDIGSHFRMAAYGEFSTDRVAHDEAEPMLMGDNAGIGAGLIATKLVKRLAISSTVGFILPYCYRENYFNQGELTLYYGNAINYSLSFGYLLYPFRYKSYHQTNINLYMEFLGKDYGQAQIYLSSVPNAIPITQGSYTLYSGNYIEMRPGIQFIFNSNTRLDLSYGTPIPDGYGGYLLGHSYARFYPMYLINIMHYFFTK